MSFPVSTGSLTVPASGPYGGAATVPASRSVPGGVCRRTRTLPERDRRVPAIPRRTPAPEYRRGMTASQVVQTNVW